MRPTLHNHDGQELALLVPSAAILMAARTDPGSRSLGAIWAKPFGCGVVCYDDPPYWHMAEALPFNTNTTGHGIHDWSGGSCDAYHPACFGSLTEQELSDVRTALQQADFDALTRLAKKRPDQIIINEERQALQILGCEHQVLAHVPLTKKELARLAD